MIIHSIVFTIRRLARNKVNSLVNIAGLAIAFAGSLLVFMYIRNELTYDSFHSAIDRLYYLEGNVDAGYVKFMNSPAAGVAPRLRAEFPEVADVVRIHREECFITIGERPLRFEGLSTETAFFKVFSFPLVRGGSDSPLSDPHDLVLSRETARKLFGNDNPVGKTVSLIIHDRQQQYTIADVTEPAPNNSSIRFDFLIPLEALYHGRLAGTGLTFPTFLTLKHPGDKASLLEKFPNTIDQDLSQQYGQPNGKGRYSLHSLREFHLKTDALNRVLGNKGNILYSYLLSGLGLLILCIACVNYSNISLSDLAGRLKEVGIRKVLGAGRREIISQFVFETIVTALIALGVGGALAVTAAPGFSALTGSDFIFHPAEITPSALLLLAGALGVMLTAGLYPAVIAARISSVDLFRRMVPIQGRNLFGKMLILMQFAIAIFLIIGTLFLLRQHRYLLSKDLGYSTDKTIRVDIKDVSADEEKRNTFYYAYINRLVPYREIERVAGAEYPLTDSWMYRSEDLRKGNGHFRYHVNSVDRSYISILGLSLIQGKSFTSSGAGALHAGVIVNESFVSGLGIEHPVGAVLGDYLGGERYADAVILGVVQDFHYRSLANTIGPACMVYDEHAPFSYVYVKCTGSPSDAVALLAKEFKRLQPHIPFRYAFLDEEVARQYWKEQHWGKIVTYASVLAIMIACAGLFGLTMHTVSRRMKEIGIRKVLGASVFGIAAMINKRFLGIIFLANALAWPGVYYIMIKYMQNYSYHISLDIWTFITGGLMALLIAAGTVSMLAVRAARRNPVKVLSCE